MKSPIYFDYAATTPVDPRVAQKMSECLLAEGKFGNPASRSHKFGWEAEEAVEMARRHMADLLNCDPREIVWTSGATESDNLAIKGVAQFYKSKGKHIVTSKIEHKAVLDTCRHLERMIKRLFSRSKPSTTTQAPTPDKPRMKSLVEKPPRVQLLIDSTI